MNQRRKHARAEVDWPVTFANGNATLQGKTKNISRGGAFLYLAKNLEVYEQIRLAIEIPEFEDVISAKAVVVRTSSLITGKNFTSFAVAVKFTEISNEDLRYFTGNLTDEWRDGYEQPTLHTTGNSSVKSIVLGFAIFFLISITFYVIRFNDNYQIEEKQVEQLRNRISTIEKKFNTLQGFEKSGTNLENKVIVIQDHIVAMQRKFMTFATVEKLQYQTDYFEKKIDKINHSVNPSRQAEIILTQSNKKKSVFLHYSDKGEDDLYRLGLKHGININKIKILNSMSQDESIYPDQKLIVGRK